jgi:hypothetical protein
LKRGIYWIENRKKKRNIDISFMVLVVLALPQKASIIGFWDKQLQNKKHTNKEKKKKFNCSL